MGTLLYPPHRPLVRLSGVFSLLRREREKPSTNYGGLRLAMGRTRAIPDFSREGSVGGGRRAALPRACLSSPCFPVLDAAEEEAVAALPASVVSLAVEEVEVAAALPLPTLDGGRCRVPVPMVVAAVVEVEDFHLEAPAPRRPALADGPRAGAVEVAAVEVPPSSPVVEAVAAGWSRPQSRHVRRRARGRPRRPPVRLGVDAPRRADAGGAGGVAGRSGRGEREGGRRTRNGRSRYYFGRGSQSFPRRGAVPSLGGIEKGGCNWRREQLEGGPMERRGLWLTA